MSDNTPTVNVAELIAERDTLRAALLQTVLAVKDTALLAVLREEAERRLRKTKFYIVEDDGRPVGVYTTHALAMLAEQRSKWGQIHERELDKLPDEPEGHREPDYGAPSAAERLERDSFDADRGVR